MISGDETRALRDATRRLIATVTPTSADEHVAATAAPPDRAAWRALAGQLGLQGVRVPEELGGAGLGLAEEMLVHAELGRSLHGGPFVPVVGQVLPALLQLSDDDRVRDLVGDLCSGTTVVVPAFARWYEPDVLWPSIRRDSDRYQVSGVVPSVLEPVDADGWLTAAHEGGEPVLLWVRAVDGGTRTVPLPSIDLTRRFADVRFDDAPATVLARGDRAVRALDALDVGAALALSAESVGIAGAALAMTLDYVKVREQFGQVIGSFQAIKHQVADLHVLLESARSALDLAVTGAETEGPARTAALAVARRRCGSAAFHIANEAIHLHGGIGFTWEHPIHLYYRRAKTNQALLDDRGMQAGVLAASVFELYRQETA